MALVLYTATAVALLALADRAVRPLSRTAALLLFPLPFCFAAYALLSGGAYAPIDLPWIDNGPGTIVVAHRPSGYALEATMQRDGWLVVSESAWRGWRASVDGKPAPLQLANAAFLSVHVPQRAAIA